MEIFLTILLIVFAIVACYEVIMLIKGFIKRKKDKKAKINNQEIIEDESLNEQNEK